MTALNTPLRAEPDTAIVPDLREDTACALLNAKGELLALCKDKETAALIVGIVNGQEHKDSILRQVDLALAMQGMAENAPARASIKAALAAGGKDL